MTAASIRHILCPVDGSEPSLHAVRQAVAIARWSGAKVSALYVVPPVYANVPEFALVPAGPPLDSLVDTRGSMHARYEGEAQDIGGIEMVVEIGQPAPHILEAIERSGIDLVVMGTHGATGFERWLIGSVTEKVLRRARCPVVTVPPREVDISRVPFQRILCAVDFSNCSMAAAEYAMSMAAQANTELVLAHVIEWPWEESSAPAFDDLPHGQAEALGEFRRRQETRALAHLRALVPSQLETRCDLRVGHGKAYTGILHLAHDTQADLIVAGVHGRNPVETMLFGSTANQLVRRAVCPVLTIRR